MTSQSPWPSNSKRSQQPQRKQLATIVEQADQQPLVVEQTKPAKSRRGFSFPGSSSFQLRSRRDDEWPTYDGRRLKTVVDIYRDRHELQFMVRRRRLAGESCDVRIVADPEQFKSEFGWFLNELKRGLPVVGFDIEGVTKKNYQDLCERKPLLVAQLGAVVRHNIEHERPVLMQLGTFTGGTLLVRICRFANLPDELRNFLADRKIMKIPSPMIPLMGGLIFEKNPVGVGIEQDVEWLSRSWGVKIKGWMDLRHLARKFKLETPKKVINFTKQGLKHLAESFFGPEVLPFSGRSAAQQRLSTLRWSFWAAGRLSDAQIQYAVFDAQVSADIFGTVTSLMWDIDPLQVHDKRFAPAIAKALNAFVRVRFDEGRGVFVGGNNWRRARMCDITEIEDEAQFPYRKDVLKRKELRANICSSLDRCMPLYEVVVNDVELVFGETLAHMLDELPFRNFGEVLQPGSRQFLKDMVRPYMAMMERAQSANCNKPHQKLMWFDPVNLLRQIRLKNGHTLVKLIRADDRKPMAYMYVEHVLSVLRYGRPKECGPKSRGNDVQLIEVLSADERAMLDAEAPPEDPAREARWKLARTLGKDALDERAGNRQLISKFLGVNPQDVGLPVEAPFDKSTDGRSEVAFAMSCDDRLSAGTNGVRAALPTDLPAEFLRPPSPERVFEDGPDVCLLGDEDERLSFVDDAMSFTSELANGTEAMPGGWQNAFKVLRVKTKRFSFAVDDEEEEEEEEEDEDPFAQFTLATKDCQTCLGDYRPKDIPLVMERVTLHPCWGCGEDRVDELTWESIAPDAYFHFYLCCTECVCNLARLCARCVVFWREKQAKLMIELARLCDAPLDVPGFQPAPGVEKAVAVLDQYIEVYTHMDAATLKRKTWYLDNEFVNWLSLRVRFYSCLSGLLSAIQYERSGKVDRDNAWFLEWLRSVRDALLVDHYLVHAPKDHPAVHELKVVETLGYDVITLEKVFRKGLTDLFGRLWIPPHFELEHGCWADRINFTACWDSHAGGVDCISYLPEEYIMDEIDEEGDTDVGVPPTDHQNGQTAAQREILREQYRKEMAALAAEARRRAAAVVSQAPASVLPTVATCKPLPLPIPMPMPMSIQLRDTPLCPSSGRGFLAHSQPFIQECNTISRGENEPDYMYRRSGEGPSTGSMMIRGRGYGRCMPVTRVLTEPTFVRPDFTFTTLTGRGFGHNVRSMFAPKPVGLFNPF